MMFSNFSRNLKGRRGGRKGGKFEGRRKVVREKGTYYGPNDGQIRQPFSANREKGKKSEGEEETKTLQWRNLK